MTGTDHNSAHLPTSLQLVDDTIIEILRAPAEDLGAVLLAGWNGFTMLATVVVALVEQWPDEDVPHRYVIARNHNHAACAVAIRYLEQAPGLPPTNRTPTPISGWVSLADIDKYACLPFQAATMPADLACAAIEVHGPHIVAARIPKLAEVLNAGLAASIRFATDPADSKALAVGVAMSSEIADAWQGRLHTFLTTSKGLEQTAAGAGEHGPRPIGRLQHDTTLVNLLHRAATNAAGRDGWASMAEVGSVIRKIDPTFAPQTYGHPNLTRLVYATGLFLIRKVPQSKGAPTMYIRPNAQPSTDR
ncbi:OST-HTH/LOTUS domain-containing protein [Nocardia vaccinii]|uniref:OST-HTH/LOTUS domain-containing protein n=1 Tax=Nocardia vaccinii TaxID=1822 RepID=UPI00082C49FD|nr:OST-HTH/LOTUS domain-containing protein [Nocardia vaccinii]